MNFNFSLNKKLKFVEYISITLISIIPLLWFKDGFHINAGDIDYGIFNYERLIHRMQLWDLSFSGGTDRSNNSASLVFVLISAYLQIFFDYKISQILFYVIVIFINSLCMRYLIKSICDEENWSSTACVIISLIFFNTNIYNAFVWIRLQINITTLGLIPFLIGIYWNYLKNKLPKINALIYLYIISLYGSPIGIQPPLIYILIICLLLLYFYLKSENKNINKNFFTLSCFYVLFSLFWLLPLFSFIYLSGYGDSSIGTTVYNVYELVKWVSINSSIGNVIHGLGDQPWYDQWDGMKYWPEFELYQNSIFFLLSVGVILYCTSIGIKSLKNENKYFGLCFLLTLIFSVGAHFPFENLYIFFMNNVPYFWIHRAPWQKFYMFTLVFQTILIYFGTKKIINNL